MRFPGALILAVGLLAGCGVGADEALDGVGATAQAVDSTSTTSPPAAPDDSKKDGKTEPLPGALPGVVALPQDPIPLFVGQVVPAAGGVVVAPAVTTTVLQVSGH